MSTNTESNYEAPEYDVPSIVRSMGSMLRGPRGKYSTNFTDVFSSDREVQYKYVNGLLAVMISFVILLIFWIFILGVLKCKGHEVGCASGQPFRTQEDEEDLGSTDDDMEDSFSSLGSGSQTGSRSGDENSVTKLITDKDNLQNLSAEETAGDGGPPTDNMTRDDGSYDGPSQPVKKQVQVNERERRTRFCFLVFSLLSLTCVPLILVLSFGPMKEATQSSDQLVLVARDTLFQVNVSIESIEDAIASASETVQSATLDIEDICPNVDAAELEARIGIDLNEMINSITNEYESMTETSQRDIEFVRNLLLDLNGGLIAFESSVTTTEEWLWLVPAVLFTVSILTAIAMLGVILAWRGNSGKKVQNFMSYGMLPLLMATTIACWIIIMFSSLGTMVGSDVCTASTSKGSPDQTIQQILDVLNLDTNSTTFKVVQAYTNSCIGPSPTEDIEALQQLVQDNIDTIWRQVSRIDSVGRAQIMETCGATELENLLLSARNLAKILTTIRRSLDSVAASLSCPRIHPIYAEFSHEVVCTDATSAVARGFFLFLVLGLSLMTMLSLRASWYQNIKAEKVYHDESEVAENMILDEHEEYLAYISKYRHEWQEYRGFDEKAIDEPDDVDEGSFSDRSSEGSSYFDEEYRSDGGGYSGSMEGSEHGSEGSDGGYDVQVVPTGSANSIPNVESSAASEDVSSSDFVGREIASERSRAPPPPSNPEYCQAPISNTTAPVESSTLPRSQCAESGRFFDKYGIDPGSSVRQKSGAPPRRPPTDPPAAGAADPSPRKSSPVQAHVLPRRRSSLRSRGSFFRTHATSDNEVEIELSDSPYSSHSSDRVFEC